MTQQLDPIISEDPWHSLRQLTQARIALGRSGMSLPTKANLEFSHAHALARDAVSSELDFINLEQRLAKHGYASVTLATQAENQRLFLQRPDLGRQLSEASISTLQLCSLNPADIVIAVVDGLSSKAIENHAEPFLHLLLPELQAKNYTLPPLCLVKHGRVALGDAIAELFSARLCIVLIGERPGLSSPDSMGIYFTYQAQSGISTDADRNCISNIHQNGLSYQQALFKLLYLIAESEKLHLSGVQLKDQSAESHAIIQNRTGNFLLD
jgi:ethanolamine ammonia-lyase small subunit